MCLYCTPPYETHVNNTFNERLKLFLFWLYSVLIFGRISPIIFKFEVISFFTRSNS